MNVNGIQPGSYPTVAWSPPAKEPKLEIEPIAVDTLAIQSLEKKLEKTGKNPSPDDLVMRPSPVSAEERMSQVISPEQMKDLLSMIVSSRFSSSPKGKMESKKIDLKG
ncbi:hypothetical protein EHQ53_02805 [Leptospira langatensis]|uniref:Uncharacterized protein n=1 Tax=Leptospira langatensis TaxID=2484983 RepID=A0A5F1ZZU0_9LEPT|nr:hypothetical protein [Leptospira langatensis]TGK04093.1 hypothetical protein EHO57_03035 [Leptospira langatensis]TGL43573.1 hypothetical protein EHQ53_02805 [Leptospira langatensis]